MIRRLTVPLLASLGLLVVLALPAAAHVTVTSDDAAPGAFAVITFRVPNEEDDAHTVGLKVQIPVDHPIPFVSVQPKDGWTIKTKTTKLDPPVTSHGNSITEAVSEIEWSGGKIGPGEFDEFKIQAGPLPEGVDSLTFKAIQTYADDAGKTHEVAWIQEAQPGQTEPEHPAPVLDLAAASTGSEGSADSAPTTGPQVTATESGDQATAPAATTSNSSSNGLSIFALAIGIAGLVMAIAALVLAIAARQKMTMATRGETPDDAGDDAG